MKKIFEKSLWTSEYNQLINITEEIEALIEEEDISDAIITIQTLHTTAGIMVNEGLECLEQDIYEFLERMAPEEWPYHHQRLLSSYGSTAGNPTSHLKALLSGNHCHFFVKGKKMVKGDAQEIYFCEFDGPSHRKYIVIADI